MTNEFGLTPDRAETIPAFLRSISVSYGSREAVVLDSEGLSFAKLDGDSALIARGLLARGVGKGTRVGMLFGNSPQWVTWWAAIVRIGAVAVPLSTLARSGELARTIRHADLHSVVLRPAHLKRNFVDELERGFAQMARSASELRLAAAPYLRWVAVTEGERPAWAKDLDWVLAEPVSEELLCAAEAEVHLDDPAVIIYTSGTSADPKGVFHTHGAVMAKAHYLRHMLAYDMDTESLADKPFFWVGGLALRLLAAMEAGGRVICREATTYRSERPLGSVGVPRSGPWADLPLAPALGMSETFGTYSWGRQPRVEGHPIAAPIDVLEPGYTVEVVDEVGRRAADGEAGEIIVRGPTVTPRLVKVRGDRVFTADGFYRTGDRGVREGGRIHFLGRIGDMVKTSGANVAPPEVECELVALKGVRAAFVTGVDHPERGQEVVAAIVVEDGTCLDPEALRLLLKDRLSSYKVPRRFAFLSMEELPRTPSHKVDRRRLGELIVERAGSSGGAY